ncbi:hypothetical protein T07_8876 [Trichinella nelsoni]|uniref:Uncharacterized protein n=1 Tax=Trichinella nelsoni TaxID=6336 RepID=A0A0V0RGI1_9BILA|nr:hypothetical protein T07_8876 [Trichinella nelsoni]
MKIKTVKRRNRLNRCVCRRPFSKYWISSRQTSLRMLCVPWMRSLRKRTELKSHWKTYFPMESL